MAYLKPLILKCDEPDCHTPARAQLYNQGNALLGQFCNRHAEAKLEALTAVEHRAYQDGLRNAKRIDER